ncbi:hypothetical protein HNC20_20225 [Rhodococcus rhodochrous]|nr:MULTISPECIES: hypothetical protein [Rhodococcus]MBF4479901.1 hypothetical protein [Rhodococcus rhodochrous]MDC3728581.1 hypothetical protein [Rhodococcus sp. Rp3]MDJ0398417.1 hypothetical protein [Rhodococcus rhodochrous]MDO1486260.1 hypothetical protein [Rhodococcus rhodochrous]
MRRRVAVVAPKVADAVRYTGGWLYDQVAAGWEVVVVVPQSSDLRPFEILGATKAVDLESALSSATYGPMPDTVAIAADLYASDERIRSGVLEALAENPTTIALWGENVPSELDSRIVPLQHRLSRAAQVFKSHALAAAAAPATAVAATESFLTGGADTLRMRGNLVSMA